MRWKLWQEIEIHADRKTLIETFRSLSPLFFATVVIPICVAIQSGFWIGVLFFLGVQLLILSLVYYVKREEIFLVWHNFFGTKIDGIQPSGWLWTYDPPDLLIKAGEADEWLKELPSWSYIRFMSGKIIFLFKEDAMMYKLTFGENR